jgi:hypothetical protein
VDVVDTTLRSDKFLAKAKASVEREFIGSFALNKDDN